VPSSLAFGSPRENHKHGRNHKLVPACRPRTCDYLLCIRVYELRSATIWMGFKTYNIKS